MGLGREAARRWALLATYVAVVLGAVPFTRGLLLGLRALDLVTTASVALYAVAALAIAYRVVFDPRLHDAVAFVAVVGVTGIAGGLMMGLEIAEERVHFLQYGLMAVLAARALRAHTAAGRAYLGAFVLATGIGWVEELMQDVLPYRYYDLKDVLLNAQGAGLGLLLDEGLRDRLGWRARARRSADVARVDRG